MPAHFAAPCCQQASVHAVKFLIRPGTKPLRDAVNNGAVAQCTAAHDHAYNNNDEFRR